MADETKSAATRSDASSTDAVSGGSSPERERALEGLEGSRLASKAAELGASEPGVHADPEGGHTPSASRPGGARTLVLAAAAIGGMVLLWRLVWRRRAPRS